MKWQWIELSLPFRFESNFVFMKSMLLSHQWHNACSILCAMKICMEGKNFTLLSRSEWLQWWMWTDNIYVCKCRYNECVVHNSTIYIYIYMWICSLDQHQQHRWRGGHYNMRLERWALACTYAHPQHIHTHSTHIKFAGCFCVISKSFDYNIKPLSVCCCWF